MTQRIHVMVSCVPIQEDDLQTEAQQMAIAAMLVRDEKGIAFYEQEDRIFRVLGVLMMKPHGNHDVMVQAHKQIGIPYIVEYNLIQYAVVYVHTGLVILTQLV